MNKKKQTLKETYLQAYESYKKKDFKNTEIICYKILSIDPYHFDSTSLLATVAAVSRNFEKAKELILKALDIQPKNKSALNNLGTIYKELGSFDEAINTFKKVLEIDSNHTNAHYNLGIVYYNLKELTNAKKYLKKTVEIQENYAAAFFALGNVHVDFREYNSAISSFQKAIAINPNLVGAYNNLGLVFRILNDFENAIKYHTKTIEIKPDHAGAHHNLGQSYKEMGDFENSIKYHQLAIKYEPNNLMHYHFLAELQKDILDDNLKLKIKEIILKKEITENNLAYGNFLLSKYDRKNKKYEEELVHLIKAHKHFFETRKNKFDLGVKYCFEDVLKISESINVEKKANNEYNKIKPIFIIGVPRCGSTLVEKIIGSGSDLIPMGEETAILENYINQKILEGKDLNLGSADIIRKELYDIYKDKGLLLSKKNNTFTDKSLNNFFYIKFIKDIYPNAKIINCNRDILSSIVSIFQNNLTELAWAHDLKNVFKYFDNYFKIIEEKNVKNLNMIYQLNFKTLVENPEEESKKIMKFCELSWDKKCLEFYKRKDLISKTASNIQIRESIYKHLPNKYFPYKILLEKYGKDFTWFKK